MTTLDRYLILTLLLVALTNAAFAGYGRFEPLGDELLRNGDFSAGLRHWRRSDAGGVQACGGTATLRSDAMDSRVQLWQRVPAAEPDRDYRLEVQIRVVDVHPGPQPWDRARVMVFFNGMQGDNSGSRQVCAIAGTRDWQRCGADFRTRHDTRSLFVTMELLNAAGELKVRDMRLGEARERPFYALFHHGLALLWVVLLAGIAHALWRSRRSGLRVGPLMLAALAILSGIMIPGDIKALVFSAMDGLVPMDGVAHALGLDPGALDWGSMGHFLLFGLFAYLVRRDFPGVHALRFLLLAFAVAITTETLQYFTVGRSPSVFDTMTDLAGMLAGAGLCGLRVARGAHP